MHTSSLLLKAFFSVEPYALKGIFNDGPYALKGKGFSIWKFRRS